MNELATILLGFSGGMFGGLAISFILRWVETQGKASQRFENMQRDHWEFKETVKEKLNK